MALSDADKAWIKAAIAADNEAWSRHLMNHVNGVGDSVVRRLAEGTLAAVTRATAKILERLG
jgi:hypothetical protein